MIHPLIISMALIAIGFFIIGYTIGGLKRKKKLETVMGIPIKPHHLRPEYHGYHGGFWQTNKCQNCGTIGLYEDMHTARPCRFCGSKVSPYGPAIWREKDGMMQWSKTQV